ncbi:E3 ubiquitin-protein ligase HECTD3-like [Acipenser oxyrinchus oxyrinchus]|uniref:E3 ubiquitin-protein ligase HECTD3-like n=1 Tax=Acipenser oxyrinchus oxyrinchus TaxID=40147 RepID=A0AAD8D7Q3_ACIOX|nr:E3 ubiquitin-protein ligase HECTD3-like [Acipenser oxyrinchus oxyrinchus]
MSLGDNPHILLGRIRFLIECIDCFKHNKPLPEALCFVPKEVCYKICKDSSFSSTSCSSATSTGSSTAGKTIISVWESPSQSLPSKKLLKFNIEAKKGTCIRATGEEHCNTYGLWVKLNKEQLEEHKSGLDVEEGWILVCKHAEGGDRLVPVESQERVQRQGQLFGYDYKPYTRWEQVVDAQCCLHLGSKPRVAQQGDAAVQKLRYVPPTWTFECDEDLVHYFYDHISKEDEDLGSIKQYVESIDVSSCSEDPNGGAWCMTDGDTGTYWESDGAQGQHWIRLRMKKGTVVKKLILTVDTTDDNYMPKRIAVYGGEGDNLKKLSDVHVDESLIGEVCVLEDMIAHLPVIEIRIVECRGEGIDVRIRGIKIKSSRERDLGLNADMFQSPNLVRYPRLEGTDSEMLYRRALVIQRFISLLDGLLPHIVPAWDYTLGTFSHLKHIKQFLLLSKRRSALITQCLKDSETSKPDFMPRLYINRRLAMEHRDNPSLDPSCKHAVFIQVYEGLKPSDKNEKMLDYRWPVSYDQWWECKFISEGIIDQGGGFRDSLADMSEELCPSSAECPVPLPFLTRTSNLGTGEARDRYVPNPSCREFHKYEWIGQLMGAALRGKEFLVLALPGIVWKQLTGEEVSWSKDFPAVDSVLVKQLEAMESMDKETFEFKFGSELTYTTLLSDGRVVELSPGCSSTVVKYEDRKEFIRLVQKARLEESREQIAAMQAGLLKVVPQAVLDLLTWQELEKKVCGDPEITVEALKRLTRYEDLEHSEVRVQYLWEALTNFTNEDRSRFLRFVTGRSRLPAPIYIFPDKQGTETTDALPQSSTCSSTLFLPNYPSAKVCEEKLRYAAYNCVAIDTDVSPWEE